jgi:hypothetical protein
MSLPSRVVRKVRRNDADGSPAAHESILTVTAIPNDGQPSDETAWIVSVANSHAVYQSTFTQGEIGREVQAKEEDGAVNAWLSYLAGAGQTDQTELTVSETQNASEIKMNETADGLSIQILQSSKSGLIRKLWGGTLEKNHTRSAFDVSLTLVDVVSEEQARCATLQRKLERMQSGLYGWKDTAQKLEGEWDHEKNELLGNFLTLYNEKHNQVKDLQRRIDELASEVEKARAAAGSSGGSSNTRLGGVIDDQDCEQYNSARLANSAVGRKTTAKRKRTISAPAKKKPTPVTTLSSRRTKHRTGAIKYYDSDLQSNDTKQSIAQKQPENSERLTVPDSNKELAQQKDDNQLPNTKKPKRKDSWSSSSDESKAQKHVVERPAANAKVGREDMSSSDKSYTANKPAASRSNISPTSKASRSVPGTLIDTLIDPGFRSSLEAQLAAMRAEEEEDDDESAQRE